MDKFVDLIRRVALQAVEASAPVRLYYGTVQSVDPLQIEVDQKAVYSETFLALSSLVQDFDVDMTVEHETEESEGGLYDEAFAAHSHAYEGRKTFRVHLGLQVGERVMLLRMHGGQKYLVLDRVRETE